MNIDRMEALHQDPEFQKALGKVDSKDSFAKLLAENGIQFTEDELKQAAKEATAELTENELEKVAGGAIFPLPVPAYYWIWNWLLRRRSSLGGYGGLSAGGGGGGGGGGSGGGRF